MDNTFLLNVTACDRVFFEGRCRQVVIPLEDGEKEIQAHHENMVFAVEVGELRIQTEDGEWIVGVVGTGFAQVINNRVSILVDTAEHPEEIDVRMALLQVTGKYEEKAGTACVGRAQEKETQTVEICGCGSSLYCIGGRNCSIPESDETE